MRDPERIPVILELIKKIWLKHPDTRFNQLIHALHWEYNQLHEGKCSDEFYRKDENELNGIVTFSKCDVVDLFYTEDNQWIEFLEKKLEGE